VVNRPEAAPAFYPSPATATRSSATPRSAATQESGDEPPHVHVEHDTASAKFWLEPVRLQRSNGFKPHELNQIRAIIEEHLDLLRESWHDYFEG
jgi:hypothetical protein